MQCNLNYIKFARIVSKASPITRHHYSWEAVHCIFLMDEDIDDRCVQITHDGLVFIRWAVAVDKELRALDHSKGRYLMCAKRDWSDCINLDQYCRGNRDCNFYISASLDLRHNFKGIESYSKGHWLSWMCHLSSTLLLTPDFR